MADDPNKRGPQDRTRINVNEPHEVRYWTETLGVTEAQLRSAVAAAGVEVKDVRVYLGKPLVAGESVGTLLHPPRGAEPILWLSFASGRAE